MDRATMYKYNDVFANKMWSVSPDGDGWQYEFECGAARVYFEEPLFDEEGMQLVINEGRSFVRINEEDIGEIYIDDENSIAIYTMWGGIIHCIYVEGVLAEDKQRRRHGLAVVKK